jgi:hypothetical protein
LTFILLVRAQDPTHTVNYFHNLPARLFFFDDTEVSDLLLIDLVYF